MQLFPHFPSGVEEIGSGYSSFDAAKVAAENHRATQEATDD